MTTAIKQEINQRLARCASVGVLLKFNKGCVYIVRDHHRYLSHQFKAAPVVLLGKGKPPRGQVLTQGMFMYVINKL